MMIVIIHLAFAKCDVVCLAFRNNIILNLVNEWPYCLYPKWKIGHYNVTLDVFNSYEFSDYYACLFSHHRYMCSIWCNYCWSKEGAIGGICCNATWWCNSRDQSWLLYYNITTGGSYLLTKNYCLLSL
jgi:hypothetical protein